MKDLGPMIYIVALALTVTIGALYSDPVTFHQSSLTDWLIAVGTLGSVVVATIAAVFLRNTLRATEKSNEIITKQLNAHRPFLVCEGPKEQKDDLSYELNSYQYHVSCSMLWRNYGKPPALNVNFTFTTKASKDELIDYRLLVNSMEERPGKTLPEMSEICQKIEHDFQLRMSAEPNKPIIDQYFSVIAIFKDSHGTTRVIEHGFKAHWLASNTNSAHFSIRFVQSGPDNKEFALED